MVLSGAGWRCEDDRSSETEAEGTAGVAAELGDGSGVFVGSVRSFLDGKGMAALHRARRWSQHWNKWV